MKKGRTKEENKRERNKKQDRRWREEERQDKRKTSERDKDIYIYLCRDDCMDIRFGRVYYVRFLTARENAKKNRK